MALVRAGLGDGVKTFLAALTQAEGASRPDLDGTIHEFLIGSGAPDVEFHDEDDTVVWRLGGAKAPEIIELLTDVSQHPGTGHYYVDMSTPAGTLVVSLNEYV